MRGLAKFVEQIFGYDKVIIGKLDHVIYLLEKTIMGQLEDLAAALDAETNAVAAKIDTLAEELKAAIANGQAPSAETLASLAAISARLKTLGQDPAAPIPPPAPEEPAPTA